MDLNSRKQINDLLSESIDESSKMRSFLYHNVNCKDYDDRLKGFIRSEEILLRKMKSLYYSDKVKKGIHIKRLV